MKLETENTSVAHCAASTYQHFDQEYDFPEANPLSELPRAFELISEDDPKQSHQKKR
jgi:hypothetical protein